PSANARHIVRRLDPEDRRTVLVTAHPGGPRRRRTGARDLPASLRGRARALDGDERATLVDLLSKLTVRLEGEVSAEQAATSAETASKAGAASGPEALRRTRVATPRS